MKDIVDQYVLDIEEKYQRSNSTEYSYRKEFEILLEKIFETIGARRIDHDAKSKDGNKPDFAVVKNRVPILYIETKDIGTSLDSVEKSEQMARYFGYTNLVLTDYLEFRFYRNGLSYCEPIKLAKQASDKKSIIRFQEKYEYLARTLIEFTETSKEPIKSGAHLAKIMGGKAQRVRDNIRDYMKSDSEESEIIKVFDTFKELLVHDLDLKSFSDMYAQTLVYGLFVARYYDETPDSFSRQEARELIPNSNPFLRHFFDHIVGPNFDHRLEYITDELCEVFSHSDVEKLLTDFYKKSSKQRMTHDPVIHFYEDFLKEYDPKLRKDMGAYYTPTPVVRFMTRSVDEILKREFKLSKGLADEAKIDNGLHKVQILDPAVGTGTFISGVIREIYTKFKKENQLGRWHKYVHNDLLPRLHGFELMMAPYTIAHLKLGMAFGETGFKYFNRRLGIYLTNTLENSADQQKLFSNAFGLAESIAKESEEALKIKNETPVMVVIGNPPYSGESNNAFYSGNDKYKVEPVGGKLKERNPKWLNDDYVKFFSFAEEMISKTGEGIVAMITAHGYIDNRTFRGMRYHLMQTFDSIYVLDLHGNTNKKELAPDGTSDENVFNIRTGVAIFIGIKRRNSDKELATVYKADLFGKRKVKFDYLTNESSISMKWNEVKPIQPNYYWIVRDEKTREEYLSGFSLDKLFNTLSVGIVTSRDKFVIDSDKTLLENRIQDFLTCDSAAEAKSRFGVRENKKWKVKDALKHTFDSNNILKINYRPFDTRYIYYHDDFIERSRKDVMDNYIHKENLGLLVTKTNRDKDFKHIFATNTISEVIFLSGVTATNAMNLPLYIYKGGEKIPNLNRDIVQKIISIVGDFSSEELLFYIYAVLHSSKYRTKYNDFLKSDFPRVMYPTSKKMFNNMTSIGERLYKLHVGSKEISGSLITSFPISGSDKVDIQPRYADGKVWINEQQYFGNIKENIWSFYVGGYQPAQKWLKDRKGKSLGSEDILHYQEMIKVISETDKLMKIIDAKIEL